MGGPITLLVPQSGLGELARKDVHRAGRESEPPITQPRPGHADFPGMLKYHTDDLRPILDRSSARNTAALVAVAAICRHLLKHAGVEVVSYVVMIGNVWAKYAGSIDYRALAEQAETSPVRCADPDAEQKMIAAIEVCMAEGSRDTLGGIFEVVALGSPAGGRQLRALGLESDRGGRRDVDLGDQRGGGWARIWRRRDTGFPGPR